MTGIYRFLRQRSLCIAWFLVLPFVSASCNLYHTARPTPDYSRLLELIRLEDKYQPLVAFSDFEKKFDTECHHASLGYFNENPQMLEKIKDAADRKEKVMDLLKGFVDVRSKDIELLWLFLDLIEHTREIQTEKGAETILQYFKQIERKTTGEEAEASSEIFTKREVNL